MQLTVWKFVGGRVCLDFVNTVGGRVRGVAVRDKLRGYEDLLAWSEAAGLITGSEAGILARRANPRTAKAVVARAVALRRAIYLLFRRGRDAQALAILNREVAAARRHEHLLRARGGFRWQWDDAPALDRMLWPVARAAADLLASSERARVRLCEGEECGWLFLDTSRNGRRHWCDMKDCGNRAKVKRFRERQRGSQPGRASASLEMIPDGGLQPCRAPLKRRAN
jgi:predicted RNA-binding Zn ribbon-like protein